MSRNWIRAVLIFLMCCFGFGQQQPDQQQQQGSNNQQNSSGQQQQQQSQQQQEQKKSGSKFGNILHKPVTASNSSQTKDTASLGPNGVGDDGMPTKEQMNEPASAQDEAAAATLGQQTTDRSQVDQFIQQGNLKNGKQ